MGGAQRSRITPRKKPRAGRRRSSTPMGTASTSAAAAARTSSSPSTSPVRRHWLRARRRLARGDPLAILTLRIRRYGRSGCRPCRLVQRGAREWARRGRRRATRHVRKIKAPDPGWSPTATSGRSASSPRPKSACAHPVRPLSQIRLPTVPVRRHQHPIDPATIHVDDLEAMSLQSVMSPTSGMRSRRDIRNPPRVS